MHRSVVLGLLTALAAASCTEAAPTPDFKTLAEKIVPNGAIHAEDIVVVRGEVRDFELISELGYACMRRGAYPLPLVERETDKRRYFDEVPGDYDGNATLDLKLVEFSDVQIEIVGSEDPELFLDVEPHRFNARLQRRVPVNKASLAKSQRWITIGNGLYPSASTAAQMGLSTAELARLFWGSIDIDYARLQNTGEAVKARLDTTREVHITGPGGTDLRVGVQDRKVFVSDGVISAADVATGGPAAQVWLPAGEVYVTPQPGTASGTLFLPRLPFRGQDIRGLSLRFEAGKLVEMQAESGLKPMQELYDASPPGKELFSFLDFGINPRFKLAGRKDMLSWIAAGAISFCVGGNSWAGGDNETPYSFCGHLPDATATFDGETVVEDGVLRLISAG